MRFLLAILLFISLQSQGQIVRTHPYYRPTSLSQSCTYPLDTYTGALAAYSVSYKLRSAYSGNAYRVRRDNDNAEQDIGYSGCHVDTVSLKNFCGSNSCYVVTLYDNTGNGNSAGQPSAANQPRVVNAGVIDRFNGLPSLYYSTSSIINWNALAGKSTLDIYFISSITDTKYIHFYRVSGLSQISYVAESGSSNTTVINDFGTPSLYVNNILQSISTRNDAYNSMNGDKIILMQGASTTAASNWSGLFKINGYGTFEFSGHMPTIISWSSDQSSNRSGIFGALNTLYPLY